MSRNETIANVFATFLTVLIAAIFVVYVPYRMVISENHEIIPEIGSLRYVGPILILMGIWGYLWGLRSFILEAQGSPLPEHQQNLMINGLYRRVRNPLYVSFFLIIFGEALYFQSLHLIFYLVGWAVVFHLMVIFCEEPALRIRFGESYERYCKSVPRWLPRLKMPGREGKRASD